MASSDPDSYQWRVVLDAHLRVVGALIPPRSQVYHCTTREAAESIVKTGFRFPTLADQKGWKLGVSAARIVRLGCT